mgnify:CR=1 FL=1
MEETPNARRKEEALPAGSGGQMTAQSALSSFNLLLSTLAHSLRGHLTGVDGGLYLIQSGRSRGDRARLEKGLAMLERNLRKLRHAVTHILYYARDREPVRQPVSPEALVGELMEAVGKRPEWRSVRFEQEIAPSADSFEADRQAVFSALMNVLAYAFEGASGAGQPAAHGAAAVRLRVRPAPGEMVFTVEARGKHLDPETKENVLSPLFPAKMEDGELGLFVANKILAAHGGVLEIDCDPDSGTTFRARLPVGSPRPTQEQPGDVQGSQPP